MSVEGLNSNLRPNGHSALPMPPASRGAADRPREVAQPRDTMGGTDNECVDECFYAIWGLICSCVTSIFACIAELFRTPLPPVAPLAAEVQANPLYHLQKELALWTVKEGPITTLTKQLKQLTDSSFPAAIVLTIDREGEDLQMYTHCWPRAFSTDPAQFEADVYPAYREGLTELLRQATEHYTIAKDGILPALDHVQIRLMGTHEKYKVPESKWEYREINKAFGRDVRDNSGFIEQRYDDLTRLEATSLNCPLEHLFKQT